MRRFFIIVFSLACSLRLSAAQTDSGAAAEVRSAVCADRTMALGLDRLYDMTPKAMTASPKGYDPVYISHYGRHGSRYAYTAKAYSVPLDMLREGAAAENLTPYGEQILDQLERFWQKARYQVGDLTPLGWEQHRYIARTMVGTFPSVFNRGSRVDACSSASFRSVLSMSSECLCIAREAPKADIYEHQGVLDIQATRPNMGKNPFRYDGPPFVFPYSESSEEFFLRVFPDHEAVLGRLFKDAGLALGGRSAYDVFFNLYMLVAGMGSVPVEGRPDLSGIFTDEEFARLWESDNYERFREYGPYCTSCVSIGDDIISKADARLALGERGADLRFGHDHVVMPLLMIMGVNGFGTIPSSADDLIGSFRTFCSPMAANIQLVFYAPKKNRSGDVLVKLLLNGEEARFDGLTPTEGPYYEWNTLRDHLYRRGSLFATR